MKYKVKTLTKTCNGYPAQWEGRTFDDKYIYIRYRFGCLRLSVSDTEDGAVLGGSSNCDTVSISYGDEYSGRLDIEELIRLSNNFFNFNECEFLEDDIKFYIYTVPQERLTAAFELLGVDPIEIGKEIIVPEFGAQEITSDKEKYICDEKRSLFKGFDHE